ncbi:hypothetical protein VPH35_010714 [Triticum aestivum]
MGHVSVRLRRLRAPRAPQPAQTTYSCPNLHTPCNASSGSSRSATRRTNTSVKDVLEEWHRVWKQQRRTGTAPQAATRKVRAQVELCKDMRSLDDSHAQVLFSDLILRDCELHAQFAMRNS